MPSIPSRERLIFALDVPDNDQAKALVETLGDEVVFYKLGLELFMAGDYRALCQWLTARNKKIFVDLKFFDIPQTVANAVARLQDYGASFATIHGNDSIMKAAADAAKELKILAVTALTSLDRGDLNDLGFQCDVEELVISRARRALQLGCAGVVASGREAPAIRKAVNTSNFLIVTPGIRPIDNDVEDDQKRTVDVAQAFKNGADYIVMGRPIRDAKDPRQAAAEVQKQIAAVEGIGDRG